MYRRNNKRKKSMMLLLVLLCTLGIGYALLTQELTINGTGKVTASSWNIYFDNLVLNQDNVSLSTNDVEASINQNTLTDISFTVTLQKPGDFYEFTVDVVNDGTMDAMIGTITNNLNGNPISTENPIPDYIRYTTTYANGEEIVLNQLLSASTSETYKVRLEYRTDITASDLPSTTETLTFNFGVEYIQANADTVIDVPHPETLYGVLEAYANEGTYAMKYTGAHQDSFTGTGNKSIYHWYADNDTNGEAILNKNNVIFAGQCWQMIRTTDTGGVKLIYNGEVENNQCLNTRGNHIGYGAVEDTSIYSSYYYGTDYEYDATNNLFALSGTIEESSWNAETGPSLIGKYTCKSTIPTATCETLYLVESYNNPTSANLIVLNKNSHYSQFGNLRYNAITDDSLSHAGYMYNISYPITSPFPTKSFSIQSGSWIINTNYYYSDTIDWNTINSNQYTLVNPQLVSTLSGNYNNLVGKFVIATGSTSNSSAYYILSISSNRAFVKDLKDGDVNTSLTIGDSYTKSGGVYTLTGNVTNVSYITWNKNTNTSIYNGKYACDGNNTSCTNLKHISPNSGNSQFLYFYCDTTDTLSYAEDISYNNGIYTLSGDIETFWDLYDSSNKEIMKTHRYTCLEESTNCTNVGYSIYGGQTYAILSNVENLESAINNMLYASNVNAKNSTIKTGIDAWYAKYLTPYDSLIEDTIFCNDRTIETLGGWDPTERDLSKSLLFQGTNSSNNLSCNRLTDKFSTQNNSAKLTYKVGLMSSPEMNLLNNKKIRNTGQYYRLGTPSSFNYGDSFIYSIDTSGESTGYNSNLSNGVRPSISLIPGIEYASGDGSMASPYIIE